MAAIHDSARVHDCLVVAILETLVLRFLQWRKLHYARTGTACASLLGTAVGFTRNQIE
jgi:hypothetical protein